MEGRKSSKEEEIQMKGEEFKRKRESLEKCVAVWKNEAADETDGQMSKEVEMSKKAGKMELKRKITGEWLNKCKENNDQENIISQ